MSILGINLVVLTLLDQDYEVSDDITLRLYSMTSRLHYSLSLSGENIYQNRKHYCSSKFKSYQNETHQQVSDFLITHGLKSSPVHIAEKEEAQLIQKYIMIYICMIVFHKIHKFY